MTMPTPFPANSKPYSPVNPTPRWGLFGRNPSLWNLAVLVPMGFFTAWLVYTSIGDAQIASREKTVPAMVVSHDPGNHNSYGYVFSLNENRYGGSSSSISGGVEVGKMAKVYYDPERPEKNSLIDFNEQSAIGPVPWITLAMGFVIFRVFSTRRKFGAQGEAAQD